MFIKHGKEFCQLARILFRNIEKNMRNFYFFFKISNFTSAGNGAANVTRPLDLVILDTIS